MNKIRASKRPSSMTTGGSRRRKKERLAKVKAEAATVKTDAKVPSF